MPGFAISVLVHPGHTAFTLPSGASLTISFFKDRVSPYVIAAFAAE